LRVDILTAASSIAGDLRRLEAIADQAMLGVSRSSLKNNIRNARISVYKPEAKICSGESLKLRGSG